MPKNLLHYTSFWVGFIITNVVANSVFQIALAKLGQISKL